jgi:hypothetical protein
VASLLNSKCIHNESYLSKGNNAYVAKRVGSKWQRVTEITNYASCAEESENGVNRKMKFKVKKRATFAIIVDAVGDGKPAYQETVLATGLSSNLKRFTIEILK